MKKAKAVFTFFLIALCVLSFCSCSSEKKEDFSKKQESQSFLKKAKEGSVPGSAYIDDCYIEITGICSSSVSGLGATGINIKFVNNSDTPKSLDDVAKIQGYHNGVSIDVWYSNLSDHKILPGAECMIEYDGDYVHEGETVLVQICKGKEVISQNEYIMPVDKDETY